MVFCVSGLINFFFRRGLNTKVVSMDERVPFVDFWPVLDPSFNKSLNFCPSRFDTRDSLPFIHSTKVTEMREDLQCLVQTSFLFILDSCSPNSIEVNRTFSWSLLSLYIKFSRSRLILRERRNLCFDVYTFHFEFLKFVSHCEVPDLLKVSSVSRPSVNKRVFGSSLSNKL